MGWLVVRILVGCLVAWWPLVLCLMHVDWMIGWVGLGWVGRFDSLRCYVACTFNCTQHTGDSWLVGWRKVASGGSEHKTITKP